MNNINELCKDIEILDCPRCAGPALVEEESNWCYYITCMDCGCHTAEVEFKSDDERKPAIEKAARLWNIGKVLSPDPGE